MQVFLKSIIVVSALWLNTSIAQAAAPEVILRQWYGMVLELVRHTPTYSPPVASRSFAYLGVTAYEAAAGGSQNLQSFAGQLNGLDNVPLRKAGLVYDEAVVMQAAMAFAAQNFFSNTGPTGQRALSKMEEKMKAAAASGVPEDVAARSVAFGQDVASYILEWSKTDGGAVIENMGFPYEYQLTKGPSHWVPTGPVVQQQKPLLPNWGKNRTFAMANGQACKLPPPPAYSEDKASAFYAEAAEVVETKKNLTKEQRTIARFWSDDPMLSPTPPGHWVAIVLQIMDRDKLSLDQSVEALARLGITVADGFIANWDSKFEHDLLRPVTYIRRTMDPKWESIMITPPFPEYPSGHSTQSGAAASVLSDIFGENFAFEDATNKNDGLAPRQFTSFWAAAEEAGISRLYGGIHFRSAITKGLEQGRCVAAFTNVLRTKK